jgi:DNA-directed RNA polymerase specialized sigma24 family protein
MMPCQYDPSPEEERAWRKQQTEKEIKPIKDQLDIATRLLCLACHLLDNYGYFNYGSVDKELSDWWKNHQEDDRKRAKKEKEELKQNALKKLTPKERKALGL